MFPAVFLGSLIAISILYLAAVKFFQRRKEKYKESVQDWKNFYRKMGPDNGLNFLEKRVTHGGPFRIASKAELQAVRKMTREWFPKN